MSARRVPAGRRRLTRSPSGLMATRSRCVGGDVPRRADGRHICDDGPGGSERPAGHGRPARDRVAARLRPSARSGAEHRRAGARRRDLRRRHCASPLCAPSRAGLLTGRLPSGTEVFDNAAEMRASLPTIAHHLRAAGYVTSLAGKMHFVGPDQLHGFEERLTTDVYPAGLDWTPDRRLASGDGPSWYHDGERPASGRQCGLDAGGLRRRGRLPRSPQDFDLARRGPADPFFLTVSFTSPHDHGRSRRATGTAMTPRTSRSPRCRRSRWTRRTPTAGGCARCVASTTRS
jgi:hypothetical protein